MKLWDPIEESRNENYFVKHPSNSNLNQELFFSMGQQIQRLISSEFFLKINLLPDCSIPLSNILISFAKVLTSVLLHVSSKTIIWENSVSTLLVILNLIFGASINYPISHSSKNQVILPIFEDEKCSLGFFSFEILQIFYLREQIKFSAKKSCFILISTSVHILSYSSAFNYSRSSLSYTILSSSKFCHLGKMCH